MKRKQVVYYLVYSLVTMLFIFSGNYINQKLTLQYKANLNMNVYLVMGLTLIKNIFFGVLLALGYLIKEIKRFGIWKFNILKAIFIGVPSLYFSLTLFIYYLPIQGFSFILKPLEVLATSGNSSINLFQILFGYTIITCFYKDNEGEL